MLEGNGGRPGPAAHPSTTSREVSTVSRHRIGRTALVLVLNLVFAAATAAMALAGSRAPDTAPSLPQPVVGAPAATVAARAETTLARHPDGDRLRAWLDAAPPAARAAMEYLLAWLPASDLGGWSADMLIENVELALAARRPGTDDATFLAFVLPHRVSQEPPQRWRPALRDLLAARVAGLDLRRAALEVNRFCREWVTFLGSSRRDQPPLLTMERGLGRCEEQTIFTICALRSVGIPARQCYTPFWAVNDNNHAWVEVWTGPEDGWHYLSPCDPTGCLDRTWFTRPARRTGIVLSVGYGEVDPATARFDSPVHEVTGGAFILNTTGVYTDPGRLVVTLPAGEGDAPADTARYAWVHVFNYGAPMPIARVELGEPIELGPGDYLVTAAGDGGPCSGLAHLASGATTRLRLDPGFPALAHPVWLRYPLPPDDTDPRDCAIDRDDPLWARHRAEIERHDREREEAGRLPDGWAAVLAGRPDSVAVVTHLDVAGPRRGRWWRVVAGLDGARRDLALRLLAVMDVKDFYEFAPEGLVPVLDEVARVRAAAPAVPDSLFDRYVLSPRLYFQAGTHDWWTELPWLGTCDPDALLDAFRRRVRPAGESRLGHVATPAQTWRSGWADKPSARACLTGLLRRHGLPARAERGLETVDVWWEGRWRPLRPFPLRTESAGPLADGERPETAVLTARYTVGGVPLRDVETWRHTRLCRFRDGRFRSWYPGLRHEGDGTCEWSLPADTYWLFGGLRDGSGQPRFVSRRIELADGDSAVVDLEIGIPLQEMEARDLAPHRLDTAADVRFACADGERSLADLTADRPCLLVLILPDHEPSTRLLTELRRLRGVTVVPVAVADAETALPAGACRLDRAAAKEAFHVGDPQAQLPLSILVDGDGETRLWLSGMRLDLADFLGRLLRE